MNSETDCLTLESVLEEHFDELTDYSLKGDKTGFTEAIIGALYSYCPELSRALEFLQKEEQSNTAGLFTPEQLMRAGTIHQTITIVYKCFRKNDQEVLGRYFKSNKITDR